MSELSFLVDLLLNHKLPKATRDLVATRITEVEKQIMAAPVRPAHPFPSQAQAPIPAFLANQAPSTQAALAKHPDLLAPLQAAAKIDESPAIVAQTPAAVAAMNSRNAAIAASIAGKTDKETGRPRKF